MSRAQALRIGFAGLLGVSKVAVADDEVAPWTAADTSSFHFMYPSQGWVRTSKPLKTHLDEFNVKSEVRRGYTAGVAVDPVKLESLEAFGTPLFVGERVVGVERKKDGVLSAELLSSGSEIRGGITYYDIAYTNESTHGNNHYLSRIAIRDEKLVVFTVQSKNADYDELANEMASIAKSFSLQ